MKAKEHSFPVEVELHRGRTVCAGVEGKDELVVMPPQVFYGDADPTAWSPEDLLVAAAASCLAVTITGVAERDELPVVDLSVDAAGVVSRRDDGRYGFKRIEQHVRISVPAGEAEHARKVVERAEASCLVAASLDCEMQTEVEVLVLGDGHRAQVQPLVAHRGDERS
jgi:uncharacterized OsmC-like protein